jgi:hypothetical protein
MSDCRACWKPARHTGVYIPWTPNAALQVEHTCETWGCPNRLQPFLEEAMDPEAVLRAVFAARGQLGPDPVPATGGATTAYAFVQPASSIQTISGGSGIFMGCLPGCLERQQDTAGPTGFVEAHDPDCRWRTRFHAVTVAPSDTGAWP